jgi:hypothetical protein
MSMSNNSSCLQHRMCTVPRIQRSYGEHEVNARDLFIRYFARTARTRDDVNKLRHFGLQQRHFSVQVMLVLRKYFTVLWSQLPITYRFGELIHVQHQTSIGLFANVPAFAEKYFFNCEHYLIRDRLLFPGLSCVEVCSINMNELLRLYVLA